MPVSEMFTARKEYKCQHCGGKITLGQSYYKRRQGGKVYNRMTYWNITWHANHNDCQPHKDGSKASPASRG